MVSSTLAALSAGAAWRMQLASAGGSVIGTALLKSAGMLKVHAVSTGTALTWMPAPPQEEVAEVRFPTVRGLLQYMGHRQVLCLHKPEQPNVELLGIRCLPACFKARDSVVQLYSRQLLQACSLLPLQLLGTPPGCTAQPLMAGC